MSARNLHEEITMSRRMIFACAAGLSLTAAAAQAQDPAPGKVEYMTVCAVCHGDAGTGDGPFAAMMNVEVPDLTGLAAANGGSFPYLKVFQIVDGRSGLRAHGSPMPVWGNRYAAGAEASPGPYRTEVFVRGRIGVLVDYLESIQE
jgi:mono/diheme cytochrome c family protein